MGSLWEHNVDYGKEERRMVDGLIVQNKSVIAIVENKKPSDFQTNAQKNKALQQGLEVAQKLGAPITIATDTKETVWANTLTKNKIKDINGNVLKEIFDPKDEKTADLIEQIKSSINEHCDQIKPKNFVNPTDLAISIWQDIWQVNGATPETCLYTFV
uniref:Uncharacterized protein n=1 Tax=Halimeda minima TaxID=170427 RepID=A0A386AYY9_9CHLO|nr:hypothetical protein [Halimeda minima]